ncbi:hypothetical protein [Xylanibacillus composti]|uniref:Uncharacterized protein n=1 Tax=Xylanibacillus composti TaxID=1572762 RepID=A0A8J4H7W1_9BACL|nr:hypothetical protein [Xylanibacillus composti]GIQ71545.1 hypothetical protein XYCOK13_43690 [Xylanibacillus composti]
MLVVQRSKTPHKQAAGQATAVMVLGVESLGRKAEPLSTPKSIKMIHVLAVGMSLDH